MKPATTTTNISFGYITGIPVTVGVTMYVLSISSVSEVMMVLIHTNNVFYFCFKNNNYFLKTTRCKGNPNTMCYYYYYLVYM